MKTFKLKKVKLLAMLIIAEAAQRFRHFHEFSVLSVSMVALLSMCPISQKNTCRFQALSINLSLPLMPCCLCVWVKIFHPSKGMVKSN